MPTTNPDYWRIPVTYPSIRPSFPEISKEDLDKIKEFLELLKAAEKFDEATNQPPCTDDRKDRLVKKLKELLDKA